MLKIDGQYLSFNNSTRSATLIGYLGYGNHQQSYPHTKKVRPGYHISQKCKYAFVSSRYMYAGIKF